MSSHNTNASHFEDTLYHFQSTLLPGVVMIIVILQWHCVFWFTKHLHLHVLISSLHGSWEEGEAKSIFYSQGAQRKGGTWSGLPSPSGMQLFLEFCYHWSKASQPCLWVAKSRQYRDYKAVTLCAKGVSRSRHSPIHTNHLTISWGFHLTFLRWYKRHQIRSTTSQILLCLCSLRCTYRIGFSYISFKIFIMKRFP